MNKYLKVLIYNIVFFILVFLSLEVYLFIEVYNYEIMNKKSILKLEEGQELSKEEKLELFKYVFYSKYRNKGDIDNEVYRCIDCISQETNNKPPIVLMGCSFTYGFCLEDEETFNAFLNKITKRKIYNWGIVGASPRETLITLRNKDFVKHIEKPEYVIYTYIPDHRRRLYSPYVDLKTNFYKKKNELVEYKQPYILYSSHLMKQILYRYANKKSKSVDSIEFFKLYIREIVKEIENLYGEETKFVIIVYDDDGFINWKEIEEISTSKNKIIVLNIKEIVGSYLDEDEYRIDSHPNAKAWEVITPKLVEKLGL